jgi:DNA-directed RNA polymerase subunit RPC12/RpoP
MKTGLAANELDQIGRRNNPIQSVQSKPVIREKGEVDALAPTVSIQDNTYLVDFGHGNSQRFHRVNKRKECLCGSLSCEAIETVRQYLQAGGMRAPEQSEGLACPICGSRVFPDHRWDGKYSRKPGWRCQKGGLSHFLQAKAEGIRKHRAENPWLIPPAPGYPGVRRDEILTWEECEAISLKVLLETGYDPTK